MEENNTERTDLDELGEFGLIERLTADFPLRNASSLKGVGDDAAVIGHEGGKTLVSVDMLVEGVHFDMTYTPLKHLGHLCHECHSDPNRDRVGRIEPLFR